MNVRRTAATAAGIILAGMVFGSVAIAGAMPMMGGTTPINGQPGSGWMMQPPSDVTTQPGSGWMMQPPSDVATPPVTLPSTDTTTRACPRLVPSDGTTPSVPASPAAWPMMPPSAGTTPAVATTITIGCGVTRVAMPKAFVLSGVLGASHIGDASVVEVMKPGTSRWSYSSARLVYTAKGDWWYRYTPKLRGSYNFRVRPAAETTVPVVSRTIAVSVR